MSVVSRQSNRFSCSRRVGGIMLLALCMVRAGAVSVGNGAVSSAAPIVANFPLYFEENRGQCDANVRFLSHGRKCNLLIAPTEATLALYSLRTSDDSEAGAQVSVRSSVLRLRFLGADEQAHVRGAGSLPGKINYLLGNDSAQWRANVPAFTRLVVNEVYPSIDLVYYGNDQRLEFDFNVAPQADPSVIAFRFEGASRVKLDEQGNLVVSIGDRVVTQQKPVAYQRIGTELKPVSCEYNLSPEGVITFNLGDYQQDAALVIDPILSYSSYFGGSGADNAWDVALDGSGAVYVVGDTLTTQLPVTPGALQTNFAGSTTIAGDAFVAKFDSSLSNLVYLTYLGGSTSDAGLALAVDGDGNAYVTGFTDSTNFPTASTTLTNINGPPNVDLELHYLDAFVTKLNASGSGIIYSLYLGGNRADQGYGISVDSAGQAYVVGGTLSSNFFTLNAAQSNYRGQEDAFVAKLNAAGQVVYSTFFGGASLDRGVNIVGDNAGFATIAGFTRSRDFMVTNALQANLNRSTNTTSALDAFVARFTPAGAPLYSTYLGGSQDDEATGLVLDSGDNVVLTGWTLSTNFVTTSNNLPTSVISNRTSREFFVTSLQTDGELSYSVIFGGTRADESRDLAVDAEGNIVVVGNTSSTNLPTTNTLGFLTTTNAGSNDVFVVQFSPGATDLLYSVYLGARRDETAFAVALDPSGNAYVVGRTASTNFPTVNAPAGALFADSGGVDAFLAKVTVPPMLALSAVGSELQLSWPAFNPEYAVESSISPSASNSWQVIPQPPVLSEGKHRVTLAATNDTQSFRLRR